MKKFVILLSIIALGSQPATAQPVGKADQSYKNELQRSIDKGLRFLEQSQNKDGYWLDPDHPAVTALCLMAFHSNPKKPKTEPIWVKKAYGHILKQKQKNGSIYVPGKGLANYNTALCLMALVASENPAHTDTAKQARAYLVRQQWDLGKKKEQDHPLDGGIGYGNRYPHSDLNNTLTAIEAIYYSRHLIADSPEAKNDLNWGAAIQFIQNCQNLPSHNKQPWASDDPKQKGGFVYFPGKSMAGIEKGKNGKTALRSYGSISYAGMLSYAYAKLDKNDPRVEAVFAWISNNYTLTENPNMGQQGLFYYYFLMTKALSIHGVDELNVKGKKVNWRREISMQFLKMQNEDGSWLNDNPRWWEKEKPLVTAYGLIALSYIYHGL
jgi:squalene-hopene/tetraprenyl-beta-curcumene cyclase